jgi:hypothetical protein
MKILAKMYLLGSMIYHIYEIFNSCLSAPVVGTTRGTSPPLLREDVWSFELFQRQPA